MWFVKLNVEFSSVQWLSCVWLFATPWTAPCQVLHHPLEIAQTHIHWVGDAIQPSHLLSSPSLPSSVFPSIRVYSSEVALCIRWPKYWSFSFSISPSNEYSGLISFRIEVLISLQSKGLSRVFSNITIQKSVNSLVLMVQLSHPYMTTGKTIALTR